MRVPVTLFAFLAWNSASVWAQDSGLQIGSRLELFVDGALIEETRGDARVELRRPTPREVVLVTDRSWEGNACGHFTVFQDDGRYRMYYRGSHFETGKTLVRPHREVICYAESLDGIRWYRPNLGLVEFEGSKANNIILDRLPVGGSVHNFVPFKDANPAAAPDARYKAVSRGSPERGLYAWKSPDGIHWDLMAGRPVITKGYFDSQNLAFWDSVRGEYREYHREFRKVPGLPEGKRGIRDVLTGTSQDFLNWTEPVWLSYPGAPDEELYTNQIRPYDRAPHILLGFPTRYIELGWSDSMRALPELEHRRLRSGVHIRYGTALTDGLFMAGRDRISFHRWQEAYIRPGLRPVDNWVYGDNYQNWGIVETRSHIEGAPNELSVYVNESYWRGDGTKLRRYTLRIDGFVAVTAPAAGGEIVTRPLVFEGSRLTLNFSTSAAGSIRVELQNAAGTPLDGFGLDDCSVVFGDELEREVRWKGGPDVSSLAGSPVRLRFALRDADLFALRFR